VDASIIVNIRGGRVEVFLNCDTDELEVVLEPVVDEIRTTVEEALVSIEADELMAREMR